MPRQQGEPAFAADEQLYRRLRGDWIDSNGQVSEDAIDLMGTSVDRGLYVREPQACLTGVGEHITAVAAIAFGAVPDRFEAPPSTQFGAPPPKPYESVVVYKPESGNIAHSEIRFCRPGATESSKIKSDPMKSLIRGLLAERMRLVYRR